MRISRVVFRRIPKFYIALKFIELYHNEAKIVSPAKLVQHPITASEPSHSILLVLRMLSSASHPPTMGFLLNLSVFDSSEYTERKVSNWTCLSVYK